MFTVKLNFNKCRSLLLFFALTIWHTVHFQLAITSTLTNVPRWQMFMFRNYNLPPGKMADHPGTCNAKIWEAIRASTSAPVYYREFQLGENVFMVWGWLYESWCKLILAAIPGVCSRSRTHSEHILKYTNRSPNIWNFVILAKWAFQNTG